MELRWEKSPWTAPSDMARACSSANPLEEAWQVAHDCPGGSDSEVS
ncbi:hypothetical protein M105_3121 [Bacteroides fragilis str. 1009-4-F |nr:hypothetical protein M101_2594 [Bacteroides fragilis str. 1007-1-F \